MSRDPTRGGGRREDPVARYLETLEKLRSAKRWSTNTMTLRFAGLALGAAGPSVTFERLDSAASVIRKRARGTGSLRSELRHVVAAMILRRGQDPGTVCARLIETREAFRDHGLPKRATGAVLAALLLAIMNDGRPVPPARIERMARVYDRWKKDHRLLTDSRDLPAAALHAASDRSVDLMTADTERSYQSLREAGFRRGNQLQLVSQLLAVDPRGVDTGMQRFRRVAERLESKGERVRSGRYDEIATLALTQDAPDRVVERTLRNRDRLRAAKPRPAKELAFSIATGIELAEDAEDAGRRGAGDVAALQSIRAILDAQQAAMVAAMSSAAAAGAAASSG